MTEAAPYLTPAEAAHMARVSPETIRRAIRSGLLPSFKRPGSTRHLIERPALDRWVKGERPEPRPSAALAELMANLPELPSFQGDPVAIQRALRDEWE